MLADGFWALAPGGQTPEPLATDPNPPTVRFNDAKCDPDGRLVAGTMAYSEEPGGGQLLRLEPDLTIIVLRPSVGVSNGLGWSADGRTMYYVDTPTRRIEAIAYDSERETVGSGRTLARVNPTIGFPDGLAVDEAGGIWVAMWGGGRVHRYLHDGTLDAVIRMPASQSTSFAFGGPDLDLLLITSARTRLDAVTLRSEPHAGGVFVARPGVRGLPIPTFRG